MARTINRIDISTIPELARLAEEVARSGTPQILERDSRPIARLVPVDRAPRRRRTKRPAPADIEAARATFGSWKGHIDAEQFKRDIKAARSDHRPPTQR
jgi:hypothetical protein